jgi:TetR/AcrR family transcriptional regulator
MLLSFPEGYPIMSESIVKLKIIEIFKRLSSVFGIRGITVDMIASECGISKKTLYKFFRSKDELVEIVFDAILDQMRTEFRTIERTESDPLTRLDRFFETAYRLFGSISRPLLRDVRRYYPIINERIREFEREQVDLFTGTISKGIRAGVFKNIDPAIVVGFLTGASNAVLNPDFILQHNLTVEDSIVAFKSLFLSGLLDRAR